jgi:hypothetical protein
MTDRRDDGPLSSDELAQDLKRSDADPMADTDAEGHTRPASEEGMADNNGERESRGPNPMAGTMLPPD